MSAAIAALMLAPTLEKAAEQCGVSASTLLRWQKIPRFRRALRAARQAALEQAVGELARAAGEAVAALRGCLADPSSGVRVRAAGQLLEYAFRASELFDLAGRVDELEQRVREADRPRPVPLPPPPAADDRTTHVQTISPASEWRDRSERKRWRPHR
jgi:hypothetical protein